MFSMIISLIAAYLIGSIPTSYICTRALKGLDIRRHGSGNVGATNVFRVAGRIPAISVLLFDIFKGSFTVWYLPVVFFNNIIGVKVGLEMYQILLGLFVLMRSLGGFGNFHPPASRDWISFFNMVKYPPSLTFTLFTLGILVLLIGLFPRLGKRIKTIGQPLLSFGSTALFFYFMHWFLLNQFSALFPEGTNLPLMYASWALVVVLLYPICSTYHAFKRKAKPESTWRLF